MPMAVPPAAVMVSAAAWMRSAVRLISASRAPARAKPWAMPRLMPDEAPATNTVLPAKASGRKALGMGGPFRSEAGRMQARASAGGAAARQVSRDGAWRSPCVCYRVRPPPQHGGTARASGGACGILTRSRDSFFLRGRCAVRGKRTRRDDAGIRSVGPDHRKLLSGKGKTDAGWHGLEAAGQRAIRRRGTPSSEKRKPAHRCSVRAACRR
ncbi:hypothetical protein CBM2634_A300031 [Cupriavidus taiwanensis]|uniref:Uncharacterized protein n=1 Tax=Cupriavidus taiwanensis TaxID=164546 RepID=A0A375J1Z7_9BURK|nr:hypothetical protein CBM2634_A300031 [Cupriavidus taiwanensis]